MGRSWRPRGWKFWLIVAVHVGLPTVGAAVFISERNHDSKSASSAVAAASPAPHRIHALGRLEPRGTVLKVSAPSGNEGACVGRLLVAEGDDVEAGALLAVLDNHDRRAAALAEAEAKRQSAQAKLEQVRQGAKAGDIAAQEASVRLMVEQNKYNLRELERAKTLQTSRQMSQQDLDQRQWNYDRCELERQQAVERLKSIREVRDTDVLIAERDVHAAGAAVQRAEAELAAAEIHAHAAGRVLRLHARPGEKIGDRGLLEMGDVAHMQAVAEVFEADVVRLQAGLAAEIKLGSNGQRLQGEIAELGNLVARKTVLSNDPVSDTDARVLEVRVDLVPADRALVERLSNARVEVTFLPAQN